MNKYKNTDMKKILIISATSKSNYELSKKIYNILKPFNVKVNLICLEDYMLPLYTDKIYNLTKDEYVSVVNDLIDFIIPSDGIIICGPEYNGSIHPIITNMISWISVSTNNWRDAFNNKISLIGTSSGGAASRFISSMKIQLEHLGSIVMPRSINISKAVQFNEKLAEKILTKFVDLL